MKAQIRNDGGAGYPTLTLFHENDTDRDILREIVNLHTEGFVWKLDTFLKGPGQHGLASVAFKLTKER